jgi:tRNA modification GTPase
VLTLSAAIEAALDFSDEGDVGDFPHGFAQQAGEFVEELQQWLNRPRAEILREGFKVVLGGPPNAGKSTLFNVLVDQDAAITSEIAGTTRDVITRSVALEGIPFQFFDTAGVHESSADAIEQIGIARARGAFEAGDLVLWLGPEGEGPPGAWEVEARCDVLDHHRKTAPRHVVSALSGKGIASLRRDLAATARLVMPKPGEIALNQRQSELLRMAATAVAEASSHRDLLLAAEDLRTARFAFDALLGRTTTEDMLDALFGRFCIGK